MFSVFTKKLLIYKTVTVFHFEAMRMKAFKTLNS